EVPTTAVHLIAVISSNGDQYRPEMKMFNILIVSMFSAGTGLNLQAKTPNTVLRIKILIPISESNILKFYQDDDRFAHRKGRDSRTEGGR
ncbi:unnamed protein product, partial [Allacma fusca]